ncbi:MAG: UPF0175 family protein [Candidatus Bathyarchaeia archaeon]
MPTTVQISGEIEDQLERLIAAGHYRTKSEAVRDAIRHLLASYNMVDIAVSLYRQGKVSVARAAQISGVSLLKMMDILAERGVPPAIGVENEGQLKADYQTLRGRK